jgi:hypothetical protein
MVCRGNEPALVCVAFSLLPVFAWAKEPAEPVIEPALEAQ